MARNFSRVPDPAFGFLAGDLGLRTWPGIWPAEEQLQQPLLHRPAALAAPVPLLVLHQVHRQLHQVPDHGLHVPAHVAHFGELGGLDLQEGRLGQFGQPPGDLGLAHPGGADHDDVLGRDFVPQGLGHLLAAPAVAQGDGHRSLGILLAHDIFIQFGHDLPGGEMVPGAPEGFQQFHVYRSFYEAVSLQPNLLGSRVGTAHHYPYNSSMTISLLV